MSDIKNFANIQEILLPTYTVSDVKCKIRVLFYKKDDENIVFHLNLCPIYSDGYIVESFLILRKEYKLEDSENIHSLLVEDIKKGIEKIKFNTSDSWIERNYFTSLINEALGVENPTCYICSEITFYQSPCGHSICQKCRFKECNLVENCKLRCGVCRRFLYYDTDKEEWVFLNDDGDDDDDEVN